MAITTYATLKTAVSTWSKRTDIDTVVDDFIDLAEAEMWQHLRIRDMENDTTDTASTSVRTLALPTGFLQMRRLRLIHGAVNRDLNYQSPEAMQIHDGSGVPRDYTITDVVEFDRQPDSAYTIEFQYFRSLTALSTSNTSNAVLTRFPMVYLQGCLWAEAKWAKRDTEEDEYQRFLRACENANRLDRRGRKGAAPQMRPYGSTP